MKTSIAKNHPELFHGRAASDVEVTEFGKGGKRKRRYIVKVADANTTAKPDRHRQYGPAPGKDG